MVIPRYAIFTTATLNDLNNYQNISRDGAGFGGTLGRILLNLKNNDDLFSVLL